MKTEEIWVRNLKKLDRDRQVKTEFRRVKK